MATELWLGPSGSEVLLPPINWIGEPGEYPESLKKNYDSATMLDGRIRVNFKSYNQRSWTLSWGWLTQEQVGVLQGLADLHQSLRCWNGLTANPAWVTVGIKNFTRSLLMATRLAGRRERYKAEMTLDEEA